MHMIKIIAFIAPNLNSTIPCLALQVLDLFDDLLMGSTFSHLHVLVHALFLLPATLLPRPFSCLLRGYCATSPVTSVTTVRINYPLRASTVLIRDDVICYSIPLALSLH